MKSVYEILDVPRDADDAQIKKAFRAAALIWHPDKRPNDPTAESRFKEIRSAYETLTDPNERKWFDDHEFELTKRGATGDSGAEVEYVPDLWSFFNASCFEDFSHTGNKSFYTVYQTAIDAICGAEGVPTRNFRTLDEDELVGLYTYLSNFTSSLTFSWADKYDSRAATERREKRAVDKENKKARDLAKREYVEEVRQLGAFMCRRDPRMKARRDAVEAEKARKKAEREAARLSVRNDARATLEERKRAWREEAAREFASENADAYILAEDDADFVVTEDTSSVVYACEVCDKSFKSSNALTNHEKSKKHKEAFRALRATLLEEAGGVEGVDESEEEEFYSAQDGVADDEEEEEVERVAEDAQASASEAPPSSTPPSSTPTKIYKTAEQVAAEKKARRDERKLKRKEKRATSNALECGTCSKKFDSKNALFKHLDATNHARSVT